MSKKTLLLIIGLILICSLLFAVYIVSKSKTSPNKPTPEPIPIISPTISLNPTPLEIKLTPTIKQTPELKLLSISPPENVQEGYHPSQKVTFIFDQNINLKTLNISTSPKITATTGYADSSNQLIIGPKVPGIWTPGTIYTITIKKGLKSTSGAILKNDVNYQIQTKLPGGE